MLNVILLLDPALHSFGLKSGVVEKIPMLFYQQREEVDGHCVVHIQRNRYTHSRSISIKLHINSIRTSLLNSCYIISTNALISTSCSSCIQRFLGVEVHISDHLRTLRTNDLVRAFSVSSVLIRNYWPLSCYASKRTGLFSCRLMPCSAP
jgi:hypothetical protein